MTLIEQQFAFYEKNKMYWQAATAAINRLLSLSMLWFMDEAPNPANKMIMYNNIDTQNEKKESLGRTSLFLDNFWRQLVS